MPKKTIPAAGEATPCCTFDQPKESYLSDPIRAALKEFEEKQAIYRPLAKRLLEDDALEAASASLARAQRSLIEAPCLTLADVRAKARAVIDDESLFDDITNCRTAREHVGKTFLKSILGMETKL